LDELAMSRGFAPALLQVVRVLVGPSDEAFAIKGSLPKFTARPSQQWETMGEERGLRTHSPHKRNHSPW
jgi:hypothetical protein